MKRFFKNSFVFIISFILIISMSVPCFASEVDSSSSSAAGFNSWSFTDKVNYLTIVGSDIIASVTGLAHGDSSSFKQLLLDLYANQPSAGVENFYEYLANGLSFDDETETWQLSDDLVDFCNNVIVDYNDRVTMVYRYPVNPNYVDASIFKTKQGYDEFVRVLKENPDKFFYHIGSYDETFGRTHSFLVFDTLESAISLYPDLLSSRCQFYDENWNTPLDAHIIALIDEVRDDDRMWAYTNTANGFNLNVSFDEIFSALDLGVRSVADGVLYSVNDFSCGFNNSTVYSAYAGAINTYKSVDDMKKDIGSQVIGGYADTYTGTPSQTITQSEVNNFVNNYYPDSGGGSGSGTGSDDSGGGSSGGVFDDIIGGIASGVGSIIKGIFSIVKQLVDAVADAIVSITKSITDLSSLLNTDFTDFLSAVFPFLPQEFITIMIAGLTLCLLGITIKIFRG